MLTTQQLLSSIYPELPFTVTEMNEIATAFSNPSVRKYLAHLGIAGLKAIAGGEPKEGESAESYLRRQAVVQGQLAVYQTLLTIEGPAKQAVV